MVTIEGIVGCTDPGRPLQEQSSLADKVEKFMRLNRSWSPERAYTRDASNGNGRTRDKKAESTNNNDGVCVCMPSALSEGLGDELVKVLDTEGSVTWLPKAVTIGHRSAQDHNTVMQHRQLFDVWNQLHHYHFYQRQLPTHPDRVQCTANLFCGM